MKNTTVHKGLFITGTDTDVGKTYIGSQIVSLLYEMNISVLPRKPIESGCELIDGELQPDDAKHYYEAVQKNIPLIDICPFRFQPAISPQRAARLINKPVSINKIQQACVKNVNENDFLFVEGAGGFYSPLCEDGLNADLAKSLQLPILLIANDQLGCINHILLTVEALRQNSLLLCAVILNSKDTKQEEAMNNLEDLKSHLDEPIFYVSNKELLHKNNSNTQAMLDTILNL